jgi:hypothetical protein
MMPRTFGDTVPLHTFTHLVDINRQPFGHTPDRLKDTDSRIAYHLAGVVPNGATIAVGIGLPDKCVHGLMQHRDLHVWTEMMSDGVMRLIEGGVVTDDVTTSFLLGSQRRSTWLAMSRPIACPRRMAAIDHTPAAAVTVTCCEAPATATAVREL